MHGGSKGDRDKDRDRKTESDRGVLKERETQ